ncbi:MAG: DNA polymerase III subunit gamma/tau [bacterium]|nr:DNA polymerase III subunit gamma/tau [bacterium]
MRTPFTALYRKYRPQTFAELVGQEHIADVLSASVKNNTTSHAYLFVGPRGTGKTSTARILARELGVDDLDIYELDAASNNSVEDIRLIKEAIDTAPFKSPFRFYIFDEVHMLSKSAFNAFLKTLEEPPAHVKFILATTEEHKVLDTIKSRCQQFTFRTPTTGKLAEVVHRVAKAEGYEVTPDAALLIAVLGDGSFRDTLVQLQKIISAVTDKKITHREVEKFGGAPKATLVEGFVTALLKKNTEAGLKILEAVRSEQYDVHLFCELVMQRIRLVMFARYSKELYDHHVADVAADSRVIIEELAKDKELGNLSEVLSLLLEAHTRIQTAYIKTVPLELLLVE